MFHEKCPDDKDYTERAQQKSFVTEPACNAEDAEDTALSVPLKMETTAYRPRNEAAVAVMLACRVTATAEHGASTEVIQTCKASYVPCDPAGDFAPVQDQTK